MTRSGSFVVFHETGAPLELRRAALPPLGHGEILVRNVYATLCRSDVSTWSGKRREKSPTILGHEIVGRIEQLGPAAPCHDLRGTLLRAGDRVTWAVYASDPAAELAQRGMPQKAPDLFKYGHEQLTEQSGFHGGLAEFTVLRRHTPVLRLDAAVPDAVAAPINCAFATVAGALRLAGDLQDRRVVVSGAGMLGLIACAMAKTAGARHVTAQDIDAERLSVATQFGADQGVLVAFGASDAALVAPANRADVVLEFSGAAAAVEASVATLDIGGVAVWVGATHPDRPVRLDAEQVVRRLLTVRGLHNYHAGDLVAAVAFVERHHRTFPFASLVREGFCLSEAEAAFRCAHLDRPFRVGVRPDLAEAPAPT